MLFTSSCTLPYRSHQHLAVIVGYDVLCLFVDTGSTRGDAGMGKDPVMANVYFANGLYLVVTMAKTQLSNSPRSIKHGITTPT